jgi:broad specificity phosphatase PhoE
MKALRVASLCIILLSFLHACAQQPPVITTFILIRHAEKANDGTKDPDLTADGERRAKSLASMFDSARIDAIYSTDYKRTRNTVRVLAANKNIKVKSYEPFKDEVIQNMLKEHNGGTILICGHTNNIPWTANLLLGKVAYADYAETDYGNMLIVSVVEKAKVAEVTHLRY